MFTSCFLREPDRMARTLLSDEAWKKVEAILPGMEGDRGPNGAGQPLVFRSAAMDRSHGQSLA
uniref:Uncharacterized protein n=1 Tax=Ralstonia solanacearum TaxID=305 RepID=A0A0S4W777_RALSL|nr:protein of unknown function [Ralstonia solanacearum]CUV34107.1 protein of unknown function [Ralstonia solanacearum]CUV42660.1 protein of unknown function [Ralstonia solanacearum]CUV62786.1 protein of unknown function [Ralstonia solanacearum]